MSLQEANKEAVRRIQEAIATGQSWLDLGDLKIKRIPDEIKELKEQLQVLALGAKKPIIKHNRFFGWARLDRTRSATLVNVDGLSSFVTLTDLDLSGCNELTNVDGLEGLTSLTQLNLFSCKQLTNIDGLTGLTSLKKLNLIRCAQLTNLDAVARMTQLTELSVTNSHQPLNLDVVADLTLLIKLNLSGCDQLTNVDGLAGLTSLTELQLSRCQQLTNVDVFARLISLTKLNLSYCDRLTNVDGLAGLTSLTKLKIINCNQLTNVDGLAGLTSLTELQLSRCEQLTNVDGLAGLTSLTGLELSGCGQLTNVDGLAGLTSLTELILSGCVELTNVDGLACLTSLTKLNLFYCNRLTNVDGLAGLTSLTKLKIIYCNQLTNVDGLAGLTSLTALDLTNCEQLTNVDGLAGLTSLTKLDLSRCDQLTNVDGLAGLTSLTKLDLSRCDQLTNVDGLAGLTPLTKLDLTDCVQLTSVDGLAGLTSLTELNLYGCTSIQSFSPLKILLSNLERLIVAGTRFNDLHPSVCTGNKPLESVRRYFAALGSDAKPDTEIKVFVLGNGGAGKSTLIGRLQDQPFESISKDSTHGVRLIQYPAKDRDLPHPVLLNIWDFGGQDIYHGTHALFLTYPAIYILLYSNDTENEKEDNKHGILIKNRLLPYWFDYLTQVAGEKGIVNSPLLLTQSKCYASADEDEHPPYTPPKGFPQLSRLLHVCAKDRDHTVENYKEKLREAVVKLLKQHPQPPLPASWTKVRQDLRSMQVSKSRRILSLEEFATLCKNHDCYEDKHVLLDALHQMGVIFYREGNFEDQIILDQSWALEAVYTVFSRDENFRRMVRKKGSFTRHDLEHFFWRKHSIQDQRVFLSFMTQCGICFRVYGDEDHDNLEYIAPDLLDPWGDRETREYNWQNSIPPSASVTAEFGLLHDGILRIFLSKIGSIARDRARYWKFGCHIYEGPTASEASICTDGNKIVMRAWDGDASTLLKVLLEILQKIPSGHPPTIVWEGMGSSKAEECDLSDRHLVPIYPFEANLPLSGLGRIIVQDSDLLRKLAIFYVIGCAYKDGMTSYRAISNELALRVNNGFLSEKHKTGYGNISVIINKLETDVFCHYFGKRYTRLIDQPEGEGTNAVLSDDGCLAWEAVKDFLKANDMLPDWEVIPDHIRFGSQS